MIQYVIIALVVIAVMSASYVAVQPRVDILDVPAGNNRLAIEFYKQISDSDENIFFSPVSMYVAFSALYEGARHDTAEQIQQIFRLEPDTDARHESIAQFMSHINREDPYSTLRMANALWLAEGFEVHDSYLDSVENYRTHVEVLDLPIAGEEKIDKWAAENTNDRINDIISPGDLGRNTVAVITNAIYFAGEWDMQFPVDHTRPGIFWKNSKESVNVDLMHNTIHFHHVALENAQMLKMPYKGDRLSMLVILPDNRDGIDLVEESLSVEMIEQWKKEMRQTDIRVTLPKFTMEIKYDLKTSLAELGMTDVFDDRKANLLGIGNAHGQNIFISKTSQKTFIDVNEVGTEAAAVTTSITTTTGEKPRFIADHPFIFLIQDDETGAILFMGRVLDPTA